MSPNGKIARIHLKPGSKIEPLSQRFRPLSPTKLGYELQMEFGRGYSILATEHFVLCHPMGRSAARDVGRQLESLYDDVIAFFSSRKVKVSRSDFPMPFIIFPNQQAFKAYLTKDPNRPALTNVDGYYSLASNRVFVYLHSNGLARRGRSKLDHRTQSTILHEATHQICYNVGVLNRLADQPTWLVEGLATCLEHSRRGSRRGGRLRNGTAHHSRLSRFLSLRNHGGNYGWIEPLITADDQFRSNSSALAAYAESWALCAYLLERRTSQFSRYVRKVNKREALRTYAAADRLADFKKEFGANLMLLEKRVYEFATKAARVTR